MRMRKFLSACFFRFSKWNLVIEEESPRSGAILVGAPHTSNWDFVLMLAIAASAQMRFRWLGKSDLFWWPLAPVLRALGGIPVERSANHGLVDQLASQFGPEADYVLAITPKGTRSKREYWHSGFYRIAQKTGTPLILCFVDNETKTTGLGPTISVTGNLEADMDKIRAFYAGKTGIRPELTSVPRLRGEEEK